MDFIFEIQKVIRLINQHECENIKKAAIVCADSIAVGRAVLMFGAGHSALPPQEAFPRIGSIVGFVQITEPELGFNGFVTGKGGQKQMSFLEKTPGFAEVILSNYALTPQDTLIVFSHSGINALPVELCDLANKQSLTTVSISSSAHSLANEPNNPLGKRLMEVAKIHIDTHVPEGDTLVTFHENIHTGGGSTIAGMVIMNAIVVETVRLLHEQGLPINLFPNHNISRKADKEKREETAVFEAYKKLIAKL